MPHATQPIKAVLFDLDGTLLDTAPDLALAVNRLRKNHNLAPLTFDCIRPHVSNGARALVKLAFDISEDDKAFEPLRQQLLHIYNEQLVVKTTPFPGIDALLAGLEQQHIAWGVVTNKPRAYTVPILHKLDLHNRCCTVICPDDVSRTKPDPEPLFLACEQLNCPPANAVYIGDHARDIEAGRQAGMMTIATSYGYIAENDSAEYWQADFCVDHAADILPLLQPRIVRS